MENNFADVCTRFSDALSAQMYLQKQYDDLENNFLKKNYPPLCQKIQYYVDKYLDEEDYANSPIYDMYPSATTIDNMADRIYMALKDDSAFMQADTYSHRGSRYPNRTENHTLIYPVLLSELYRRRMRKYLSTIYEYPATYNPFI